MPIAVATTCTKGLLFLALCCLDKVPGKHVIAIIGRSFFRKILKWKKNAVFKGWLPFVFFEKKEIKSVDQFYLVFHWKQSGLRQVLSNPKLFLLFLHFLRTFLFQFCSCKWYPCSKNVLLSYVSVLFFWEREQRLAAFIGPCFN